MVWYHCHDATMVTTKQQDSYYQTCQRASGKGRDRWELDGISLKRSGPVSKKPAKTLAARTEMSTVQGPTKNDRFSSETLPLIITPHFLGGLSRSQNP